ncbi:uncharacterized protein LOC141528418 [Cotesia typhae]|uniref:uncharacterized protein LOC141528418 n=1 Tax=Cotesia typhae TaxID=2053667 RepID=UPI003D684CAE
MATIQPSFFGEFFFVGECEVIELEFSRRQKRFTDSRISFPLKAFGRRRTLNLRPSSGVIIGSNTPVYFAYSNTNIQRKNIQMLSTLFRSQFYEDEENLAAFTLDVDSEGPKIKYGIVRSENLTITPLNPPTNSSESSPRQYYLAKSTFIFTGFPPSQQRTTPVPAQLYPEILLVLDYDLLIIHQNSILQHLINFWNQVNVLFQPIENPRFQLSIAGIVILVNDRPMGFRETVLVVRGIVVMRKTRLKFL